MESPHEYTLSDIRRVGEEAEGLARSAAWQRAVAMTQARIFEEWTRASVPSIREELHAEMRAFERLQDSLLTLIEDGLVAGVSLDQDPSQD